MNLNDKTAAELRKLAAQFNIAGRSTMKKAELIDALNAPERADLVEFHLAINEITPEQEERFAEQYNAAKKSDHNPETDGRVAAVDITAPSVIASETVKSEGETYTRDLMSDMTTRWTPKEAAAPAKAEPTPVRVEMERTEPGLYRAEMSTNEAGIQFTAVVFRQGRHWILTDLYNHKPVRVRAGSLAKLAKRWARKRTVWAADIRIA